MSRRWGIRAYKHPEAFVWGQGLWVSSGFKISISVLTWGSCERESKNSPVFRWGGVPTDHTRSDYRKNTPNRPFFFTVWARLCLDPHLYFPTAPLLTCEPGETLSAWCSIWQHFPFFKQSEELQSRNPHFSKTIISRTWRVLDGLMLRHTITVFVK